MFIAAVFALLLVLFYFMGKVADLVVTRIRKVGALIGIKVFFLGIILGLFTSVPEFSVGINSLINNVPDIALGNLLGGIIVVLGLVFGLSIVLNRSIKTDGKRRHFFPILAYLFLPFLFSLDGQISRLDSLLFIFWYVWLLVYLYYEYGATEKGKKKLTIPLDNREFLQVCFGVLIGIISIMLLSSMIVRLSEVLLSTLHVSGFFVGVVVFALGTNLPEGIVMLRAWKQGLRELSTSHLVGAVIADPFLMGFLGFMQPFHVNRDLHYINLFLFTALLFVALGFFYVSGKKFSRSEGYVLLAIYVLFVLSELALSVIVRT